MVKNEQTFQMIIERLISEAASSVRAEDSFLLEEPELLGERSIKKNKHPFKALFVLGPAGSGKSFISGQIGISAPMGFEDSNPDIAIEDVFPAFGISLKFAAKSQDPDLHKVQQQSRKIFQNAVRNRTINFLSTGTPIIFDTTGEESSCPVEEPDCDDGQKVLKMIPRMKELQKWGYDVGLLLINVPPKVSVDRDQNRSRTVGAEMTDDISQKYQANVVQGKGYHSALADTNVKIFGGDDEKTAGIYPNVFDLRTGELLPGIDPEDVEGIQPGGYSSEEAGALLKKLRSELTAWLQPKVIENPVGQDLYAAMKAMVALTGKYGQNIGDLVLINNDAFLAEYGSAGKDTEQKGKGTLGQHEAVIKKGAAQVAALGGIKNIEKTVRGAKSTPQSVRDLTGSEKGNREGDFEATRELDTEETEDYISALKSGDTEGQTGKFTKKPLDSPEAIAAELKAAEKELEKIPQRKKGKGFGGGLREDILKIVKRAVRETEA